MHPPRPDPSFYDKFYRRQNSDPYPRGYHPRHHQQNVPHRIEYPLFNVGQMPMTQVGQGLWGASPGPVVHRFMGVYSPRMEMNAFVNTLGPYSQGM